MRKASRRVLLNGSGGTRSAKLRKRKEGKRLGGQGEGGKGGTIEWAEPGKGGGWGDRMGMIRKQLAVPEWPLDTGTRTKIHSHEKPKKKKKILE